MDQSSSSSSSITSSSSSSSSSSNTDVDKQKLAEEVKGKTSAVKNLVAGGVGGVCAVIVGQPFDMVGFNFHFHFWFFSTCYAFEHYKGFTRCHTVISNSSADTVPFFAFLFLCVFYLPFLLSCFSTHFCCAISYFRAKHGNRSRSDYKLHQMEHTPVEWT